MDTITIITRITILVLTLTGIGIWLFFWVRRATDTRTTPPTTTAADHGPRQKSWIPINFIHGSGSQTEYWIWVAILIIFPSAILFIIEGFLNYYYPKSIPFLSTTVNTLAVLIPISRVRKSLREAGENELVGIYLFRGHQIIGVSGGLFFEFPGMRVKKTFTEVISFDFGKTEVREGSVKDWTEITTATHETCNWEQFKKYWIADQIEARGWLLSDERTGTMTPEEILNYMNEKGSILENEFEGRPAASGAPEIKSLRKQIEKSTTHKHITLGPKVFGNLQVIPEKIFDFFKNVPGLKDADENAPDFVEKDFQARKEYLIKNVKEMTIAVLNTEFKKFTHAQLLILTQGKTLNKKLEEGIDNLLAGQAKNSSGQNARTSNRPDLGVDCTMTEINKLGASKKIHDAIDDAQEAAIDKEATITAAEAAREEAKIKAEGEKSKTILNAEADQQSRELKLEVTRKENTIEAEREAKIVELLMAEATKEKIPTEAVLQFLANRDLAKNANHTFFTNNGNGGTSGNPDMVKLYAMFERLAVAYEKGGSHE